MFICLWNWEEIYNYEILYIYYKNYDVLNINRSKDNFCVIIYND